MTCLTTSLNLDGCAAAEFSLQSSPPDSRCSTQHFGAAQLTDRLRRSEYFEPDHTKADLFW